MNADLIEGDGGGSKERKAMQMNENRRTREKAVSGGARMEVEMLWYAGSRVLVSVLPSTQTILEADIEGLRTRTRTTRCSFDRGTTR